MWQQWLIKSGRGNIQDGIEIRGPAPPAAVATAAKIAFASLGNSPKMLFQTEVHQRPVTEGAPVDPSSTALLERTDSGTLCLPVLAASDGGELVEWEGAKVASIPSGSFCAKVSAVRSPVENLERRNRNLQWLRLHFRSLSDIGRLPFNNADLWQLHQYYFSPPIRPVDDGGKSSGSIDESEHSQIEDNMAPPPTVAVKPKSPTMDRSISFQSLGSASVAYGFSSPSPHKRRSEHDDLDVNDGPASKRVKSLKTRIAYYPRISVSWDYWAAICCLNYSQLSLFVRHRRGSSQLERDPWT
jgi:hypothetical protein